MLRTLLAAAPGAPRELLADTRLRADPGLQGAHVSTFIGRRHAVFRKGGAAGLPAAVPGAPCHLAASPALGTRLCFPPGGQAGAPLARDLAFPS